MFYYLLNDKINNVIDKLNDYIKKNIHELKKVVIKTNGNNVLIDLTNEEKPISKPLWGIDLESSEGLENS